MTTCHRLLRLVDRFAETIRIVQERIRHAVATEIGQAVGQTAQDLLHTLLRGSEPPRREFADFEGDEDSQHHPDDLENDDLSARDDPPPVRPLRVPWLGLSLGLVAGLAAWCGFPLVTPAVLTAAAEWIALARWAYSPF